MLARFLLAACSILITFPPVVYAESKFRFGISAPLSGVLAEYGAAITNGLALAKEDRAQAFSQIEVSLEDSQWDPKTAVTVFNALAKNKHAQLIYSWGNPPNTAVAPIAEQLQVPTLAMSSDQTITHNRSFIVRTVRGGEQFGGAVAEYFLGGKSKRCGVALAEVSYLQGIFSGVTKFAASHDSVIELLGTFEPGVQDFRSIIATAKSKKLDCVGVLLITGQVQSFYRQMRDQKFLVPTFGGDFLGSETEIQASGPAIEGAVFPDTAVKQDFRTRYKERFGNDIQISFAANAYDVAVLVAENFGVAGASDLTNIEVLKRLRSAKPIHGAQRAFSYEEDPIYGPAFVSPLVVRSVQQGKIHDVKFVFE